MCVAVCELSPRWQRELATSGGRFTKVSSSASYALHCAAPLRSKPSTDVEVRLADKLPLARSAEGRLGRKGRANEREQAGGEALDLLVGEGAAVGEQGDSDAEEDDQDGAEQGEEGEEGGQEEGGEEAGDGEGETGEGLGDSEEEEDAPLDPVSPGVNERDVIKNLLAEAYEEENELKEVSKDLEQKMLLLERFKTRRGSVIGLTSSIVHDIEARYMSSLLSWSDYMQEEARIAQHYQTALMDLRMRLEDKDKKAIKLEEEYAVFKEGRRARGNGSLLTLLPKH